MCPGIRHRPIHPNQRHAELQLGRGVYVPRNIGRRLTRARLRAGLQLGRGVYVPRNLITVELIPYKLIRFN